MDCTVEHVDVETVESVETLQLSDAVVKYESEEEDSSTDNNLGSQPESQDSEDSDDNAIYPESLLKVEVNETDEVISPPFIQKKPIKRKLLDSLPELGTKKSPRLQNKPRKRFCASDAEDESQQEEGPKRPKRGRPRKSPSEKVKDETEYICKTCDRICPNRTKLMRHLKSHKGDVRCPVCNAPFISNKVMGKHVVFVHKKTEQCDKCPMAFYTKEQLQEHIKKNKHKIVNEVQEVFVELSDLTLINRRDVNYEIQAAIVSKLHKAVPVKDICRMYNIAEEVVNEIWNDRNNFILPKKIGRRTIAYINKILEPLLLEWYNNEKAKEVYVTGRMIQNVAEQIAREKGFVHFNAGNKWLEGFKKRHSIYLSKRKERNFSPTAEPLWKIKFLEEQWLKIRAAYTDDEIYAADEVGLFYNPSKSREKKFAGKKYVQGEMDDRFSILLCANMSGTDKRKLLVCGSTDPLKNLYGHPSTLPVDYKRHSRCHFTTDMFEEYVQKWNEDLKSNNQKALVLLDRASIHSKLDMSNLHLEFLPWKAMNTLMPIRSGVYTKFRTEFRNLLLQFKTVNVIKGQDRHLTSLEGLEMLAKAWYNTPSYSITKSFLDNGFEVQEVKSSDPFTLEADAEKYCEFLRDYDVEPYFGDPSTLDMYVTVDEDLLVGKGTRPSLFGGNHKVKDDIITYPIDTGKDLPLNTGTPISDDMEQYIRNIRKTQAEADLQNLKNHHFTT